MPTSSLPVPQMVRFREEARNFIVAARAAGKKTAAIMTMGALHDGHLSLIRMAKTSCDYVVVTLFVNPTQFGPQEDFERYPRQLEADVAALSELSVDLIFAPAVSEIYRSGHSTFIEPPEVAATLEGICRPGHFRGVTTVVVKLLNILPVDEAYFGQKDYQQATVIRHTVEDLDLPVQIKVGPTIREPDGLAMSSRNRYLSPQEREQALAISRALSLAAELFATGERNCGVLTARMRDVLYSAEIHDIDYVAVAHPDTLKEQSESASGYVALIAARIGKTRLIDNRVLHATNAPLPS